MDMDNKVMTQTSYRSSQGVLLLLTY
jgi:hypothetical protein